MSEQEEPLASKKEKEHKAVFGSTVPNQKKQGIHETHYIDRNSIINVSLLLISFYGFFKGNYLLACTWIIFLIFEDVLFFGFGYSIFSTEIGIKRGYQFAHLMLDEISGHGRDLGFNLYDGNINKSYKESQIDKYKYIASHLGLKPGMKLLDCGCGYGDWLNYAKTKLGMSECVGINISPEQSKFASSIYGLEIYNVNWKEVLKNPSLQKKLYNRFDVITFFDTVEHYVSGQHRKNEKAQAEIYSDMFKMANNLLNPKSSLQKVFISCLHQNQIYVGKSFGFKGKISAYLLTRYHSGFYPPGTIYITTSYSYPFLTFIFR